MVVGKMLDRGKNIQLSFFSPECLFEGKRDLIECHALLFSVVYLGS